MAGFRTVSWLLGISLLMGVGQAGEARTAQVNAPVRAKSVEAAQIQYQQAKNFLRMGSSRAALRPLTMASELYRSAGDPIGEHNSLVDLSFAHYRLGDFNRAQQTLHQANQLTIPASAAVAQRHRGFLMQALIWLEQGNITRSWQQLRQVQRGFLQDFSEQNRLNLALGEVYRHTGQYGRALDTLHATLSQSSDRVDRTRALGEVGSLYYTLGDYGQAESAYQTALGEARSVGYWEGIPRYLNGLGHVYRQQQTYDKAREAYLEAKDIAISQGQWHELASILNSLGELYGEQGAFNKALETFTEALGYRDQYVGPEYSRTLNHLGQLYARQDRETALEYFNDAYAWARHHHDEVGQINALSGMAEIYQAKGNLSQAKETLYGVLDKFEALEPGLQDSNKVSLFETQSYRYDQLQQVLIEQGDIEAALVVAERGRARAFVELLAAQTLETATPVPVADLTIAHIKALAKKQGTTLVQYSIIRQPSPGGSQFNEQALFIWVVNPDGEIAFEQVDLTQQPNALRDKLTASQDSLGVRGFNSWGGVGQTAQASKDMAQANLKQLYDLLIAPIAQYLPEAPAEKVVIVPHRQLFLVPFPALQNAQGQYLIENHTLGTTPSLQTLHFLQQRLVPESGEALVVGIDRAQAASAVIVGNPEMPSVPFRVGGPPMPLTDLPGAEAEAVAIAPILNTVPLLGAAATETAVRERLADADIIHLATHGLLDERHGLSSAIALTPTREKGDRDQPDDGLLTAQEVMQLDLKADLVVLSACNTGRGRITGDGVVGLSRSFLAAGANNLVASLWAVPDEATAMLMTEFYQQLQTEPDKAVALRQAMLRTLADHPDPRDWAAFFLIGL